MKRGWLEKRGLTFKTDWKRNEQGQIMMHVTIKQWYMPILLAKQLHLHALPFRYWVLFYWRYFTRKRTVQA